MYFIKSSSFNVLYSRNLELTLDFYMKIGSEIKQSEQDKIVVEIGDFDLHFILNTTELFEEYKFIANSNEYGSGNIFYIEVDDLDKFYEVIKKAGGQIKSEIKPNHWDCREFLFEDPNGYKFVAYQ